jgi:hypothetical protein
MLPMPPMPGCDGRAEDMGATRAESLPVAAGVAKASSADEDEPGAGDCGIMLKRDQSFQKTGDREKKIKVRAQQPCGERQ